MPPSNTETHPIRVMRQILTEPDIKHHILVTTTTLGIKTVEPRLFEKTSQIISAAHDLSDFLLLHLIHIQVSSVLGNAVQLPKYMLLAYSTRLPTAEMTVPFNSAHRYAMKTSESAN